MGKQGIKRSLLDPLFPLNQQCGTEQKCGCVHCSAVCSILFGFETDCLFVEVCALVEKLRFSTPEQQGVFRLKTSSANLLCDTENKNASRAHCSHTHCDSTQQHNNFPKNSNAPPSFIILTTTFLLQKNTASLSHRHAQKRDPLTF
jgi:hypothetical protein